MDGQADEVGTSESPSYSSEQRRTIRRGHRILARVAIRAHLQRQASQSEAAQSPRLQEEHGT